MDGASLPESLDHKVLLGPVPTWQKSEERKGACQWLQEEIASSVHCSCWVPPSPASGMPLSPLFPTDSPTLAHSALPIDLSGVAELCCCHM